MDKNSDKKLNIISDLLKSHDYGLTITDIMSRAGFSRHTVLARLYFLMGSGDVSMRQVNMAKLHYWVGEKDEVDENIKLTPLTEKNTKKIAVFNDLDKETELRLREKEVEVREKKFHKNEKETREKSFLRRYRELELREKELELLEGEGGSVSASRHLGSPDVVQVSEPVVEDVEPIVEKVVEEVEKVEEKAEEKIEKVGEKIEEKVEKVEEKIEDKVEKVAEKIEDKVEDVSLSVKEVKTKLEESVVVQKKEMLDMVAIKKYIRGEITLDVLNGAVKKTEEKKTEPVSKVLKKPKPVIKNLDMGDVKESIRKDVKGGNLNKSQAQVLEQRAPVSHVVEGTVHLKKPKRKKQEFLLTGVPGFDDLFEKDKGIPKGAAVLVAGGAGSGKTLLCLQTMINRANLGEKCLFMSFEESEERLIEHMEMFGWNPRELIEKGTLLLKRFNPYEITRSVDALLMKAKGELLIEVDPIVFPDNFKPDLIVLDSLTAVASAFTAKEDSYRIYIEQLFRFFENLGSTAFLITETKQIPTVYSTTGVEEFLADGVVVIYNFKRGNTRENALEVLKMRGVKHQKKIVAMRINDNGMTIYPDQEVYGGIEDK